MTFFVVELDDTEATTACGDSEFNQLQPMSDKSYEQIRVYTTWFSLSHFHLRRNTFFWLRKQYIQSHGLDRTDDGTPPFLSPSIC